MIKTNPILQYPAKSLLRPSVPVEMEEAEDIVRRLREASKSQEGVLGMAAPQIGINKRVFIACHEVYINPKIRYTSHLQRVFKEACFSVDHAEQHHYVMRYTRFSMEWQDELGDPRQGTFTMKNPHDPAHVVQHEYDHLQGILINRST